MTIISEMARSMGEVVHQLDRMTRWLGSTRPMLAAGLIALYVTMFVFLATGVLP